MDGRGKMTSEKEEKGKEKSFRELRSAAEVKAKKGGDTTTEMAQRDPRALIHELQVHQIELEMQNEELQRAHVELRELYEKFRDLYDFAPVSYFTLDNDGRIVDANLAAVSLLGVDRRHLRKAPFNAFIRSSSLRGFQRFIRDIFLSDEKQKCEVDLILSKRATGRAIIEGIAITGAYGKKKEIRIALMDITALRRAEEALKKAHDELEKKVEERTAELREKDRMLLLQSRQAAMGEMIGNIAHQWRQPLNALGLTVQSLLFMSDTDLKHDVIESTVSEGMRIINNMSQTIDDFRNFFRPDRGKSQFHLDFAVAKSLSLIGDSLRSRRIAVQVVKNGDPLVTGFPNEFFQAVVNILLNARDAFEERNIEDPRLVVVVGAKDGRGVVTIADNAGGISEDIIDKIFEPYFTTKGPDKGTGVGLFMARSIIEKSMGGKLSVRNTDDGAEFRIEV